MLIKLIKNASVAGRLACINRYQKSVRCITSSSSSSGVQNTVENKSPGKYDWTMAIREAEKLVSYQSSLLTLKWLMSDASINMALQLRKLVGTKHPMVKTTKELIKTESSSAQSWGLIILLLSKAAGRALVAENVKIDENTGVLESQKSIADIAELIRMGNCVHQGMVNLQKFPKYGTEFSSDSDMVFGNKIALLGGDFLLGNACLMLSDLRNQDVFNLISSTIRDISESNFIGDRDEQNNPLPSDPAQKVYIENPINIDYFENTKLIDMNHIIGYPEREWSFRNTLLSASLLGKSCHAVLKLANLPEDVQQQQGYMFGKNIALAWQASADLEPYYMSDPPYDVILNLVSAPILFHLESDPSLYEEIKKGKVSVENIDYRKIHKIVSRGPGIEKTLELQRKHAQAALNLLEVLPTSDAKRALQNLITLL